MKQQISVSDDEHVRMATRSKEKSSGDDSSIDSCGELSDVMSNDTKNTDVDEAVVVAMEPDGEKNDAQESGVNNKKVRAWNNWPTIDHHTLLEYNFV